MSKPMNRRVTDLEARRAATRVGREIDRERPRDDRNAAGWLASLSDIELDELLRHYAAEHPHVAAQVEALTDAELDASITDLERQIAALDDDDAPLVAI